MLKQIHEVAVFCVRR